MPGICGGIGCLPEESQSVLRLFRETWKDAVHRIGQRGFVCGHAPAHRQPLADGPDNSVVAVDGEWSIYENVGRKLFTFEEGFVNLLPDVRGNVAVLDESAETLYLATEWTGSFPLYYTITQQGLLFSSQLRILAKAVHAEASLSAILDYVGLDHQLGDSTFFKGIHSLQAGQSLRFDGRTQELRIQETSRLWTGGQLSSTTLKEASEQCSQLLAVAVKAANPNSSRHALMMSGGWDSRTLLGHYLHAPVATRGNLLLYTHGDTRSQELQIVQKLARMAKLPCKVEPMTRSLLDPAILRSAVLLTESGTHPHFFLASQLLSQEGTQHISTGVLGEVLGGRYSANMLCSTRSEMAWFYATCFLPGRSRNGRQPVRGHDELAARLIPPANSIRFWFFSKDARAELEGGLARLSEERWHKAKNCLSRLSRRGVETTDQLVEAFVSENRGAKSIVSQALACRSRCSISLPFADRELMKFASQIPFALKRLNRLNHALIQEARPELLKIPTAAVAFVPASYPTVVQLASQFARRVLQNRSEASRGDSWLHARMPRFGWLDLEFMNDKECGMRLIDSLHSTVWDKSKLAEKLSKISLETTLAGRNYLWRLLLQIHHADCLMPSSRL